MNLTGKVRTALVKLQFLGAARQVTGSQYYLEADGARLLVDCGMYQERAYLARNWDPSPVRLRDVHAMLLTHAHVDHCGLAPKLVREGFRGPIYHHLRLGRSGRVGAPRRRRDSSRRRRVQGKAASQGRPPRQAAGQAALHAEGRGTHAAAVGSRALRPAGEDQRPRPGRVPRRRPHPRLGDDRTAGGRSRRSRGGSFSPATWANGTGPSSATRPSSPRPITSSWNRPTATARTRTTARPSRNCSR